VEERLGGAPEDDARGDAGGKDHREVRRVRVIRFGVGAAESDRPPRTDEENEGVADGEEHGAQEDPVETPEEDAPGRRDGHTGLGGREEAGGEEAAEDDDRHAERDGVLSGEEAAGPVAPREVPDPEEIRRPRL